MRPTMATSNRCHKLTTNRHTGRVFISYTRPHIGGAISRITLSISTDDGHVQKVPQVYNGPDRFLSARQIRPAIRPLTSDAAKTIVQDFIACRLDWCNSLLYGVPENLLRKVQSVQNAAARLLTNTRRRDHITPVLRQLHWLPVHRRVEFKTACLAH